MKKSISNTHDTLKVMAMVMTLSLVFIQPVLQIIFFIEDTTPTVLMLGSEENNEEEHQDQGTVDTYKLHASPIALFTFFESEPIINFKTYNASGFSEIIQDIPLPPPDVA